MTYAPVFKLSLVKESSIESGTVTRSEDISRLASPMFEGMDREQCVVMMFNSKKKLIGANVVSIGSLCASLVHPREVMKAVILANAASFALVHNHPSGDCTPSPDDRDITDRIKLCGEVFGIPLIDHVILGEGKNFSFHDGGLLRNL